MLSKKDFLSELSPTGWSKIAELVERRQCKNLDTFSLSWKTKTPKIYLPIRIIDFTYYPFTIAKFI